MVSILISIMTTIISILIGALITWFLTYVYYKKAGEELRKEGNELRKLNTLMLRGLEDAGLAEFGRDSKGNPTTLLIKLSGEVKSSSKVTGELTVDGK